MISLITFIKTTPAEVVPSPPIKPLNETLEILTKVNEFYDSAWSKLIIVATVIGFLVPFIVQIYQTWILKLNKKKLEAKIKKEVETTKKELELAFQKTMDEKIIEFESKIDKLNQTTKIYLRYLQANQFQEKGFYYDALIDYLKALEIYIELNRIEDDGPNLKAFLNSIIECLNEHDKDVFGKLAEIDIHIKVLLNSISGCENGEKYLDEIQEVRNKIAEVNNK